MKQLVPLMAIALIGATAPQGGEGVESAPGNQAIAAAQPMLDGAPTPVINPDRRCADTVVTAEGREGEGQFRREPAGPNPPPLFRAVDVTVGGCTMLVTMSNELRPLPGPPARTGLIPIPNQ